MTTERSAEYAKQILHGVKAVVLNKMPLATAARTHDVPRNSLRRYVDEVNKIDGFFDMVEVEQLAEVSYISSYHGPQVKLPSSVLFDT